MLSIETIDEKFKLIYKNIDFGLNYQPVIKDHLVLNGTEKNRGNFDKNEKAQIQQSIKAAKDFDKNIRYFIENQCKSTNCNNAGLDKTNKTTTNLPSIKTQNFHFNQSANIIQKNKCINTDFFLKRNVGTNISFGDNKKRGEKRVVRIQSYCTSVSNIFVKTCEKHCYKATSTDDKQNTNIDIAHMLLSQAEQNCPTAPLNHKTINTLDENFETISEPQNEDKITCLSYATDKCIEIKCIEELHEENLVDIIEDKKNENELLSLNTFIEEKKVNDVSHCGRKCYDEISILDDSYYSTSSEIYIKPMSNETHKIDTQHDIYENFQLIYDLVADTFQSTNIKSNIKFDDGLEEIKDVIESSQQNITKANFLLRKYKKKVDLVY